jgi:hypothetical protein
MGNRGYEEKSNKMIILAKPVNKKNGVRTLLTPLDQIIHGLIFLLNFLDTPRMTDLFQGLVLHLPGV